MAFKVEEFIMKDGEEVAVNSTDRGDYVLHDESEWLKRTRAYVRWHWAGFWKIIALCVVGGDITFLIFGIIVLREVADFYRALVALVPISIAIVVLPTVPFTLLTQHRIRLYDRRPAAGHMVPALYVNGLECPTLKPLRSVFVPYSELGRIDKQESTFKENFLTRMAVGSEDWYNLYKRDGTQVYQLPLSFFGEDGVMFLYDRLADREGAEAPDLVLYGRRSSAPTR